MSAPLVFLTGATGFIGLRLAEQLHRSGARLRCLVRTDAKAALLRDFDAEIVPGEVTDRAVLRRGMRGCSMAYHLAAKYDLGVVDARVMERSNVEGTRAFLDSAAATGIEKAVYVSTTVALGPGDDGESVEAYAGPYPSVYHRTKAEAHRIARAVQARGHPVVIACPAYVYGPRDEGPAGRFIRDLLRRRVPGLLTDPGWFSFVHVDDVASGLRLIGEQGQSGATYVLSGEAESMNGFAERVTKLAGVRAPVLRFPPFLASLTGRMLDGLTRATGVRFPITRETVDATAHDRWLHSHARARQELGWQPRSLDVGLPETVSWFQKHLT